MISELLKKLCAASLLAGAFMLCSCQGIREIAWEICDGDKPPPQGGIVPPPTAKSVSYSEAEAVNQMANKLIFVLSMHSSEGLPPLNATSSEAGFALTERVYQELMKSKSVSMPSGGGAGFVLYGSFDSSVFSLRLSDPAGKEIFNESIKIEPDKK